MFLKKGIFRILFSDIVLSNFCNLKHPSPNFLFQHFSEKTLSRILPILTKLVGKAPVGMMEWWSNGGMEIKISMKPSGASLDFDLQFLGAPSPLYFQANIAPFH